MTLCCCGKDANDAIIDKKESQLRHLGEKGLVRCPPPRLRVEEEAVPVTLNVYSLIEKNKNLTKVGLGVFHTGVIVYGIEWSYGEVLDSPDVSGLFCVHPGQAAGTLYKTLKLGYTTKSPSQVDTILHRLENEWRSSEYHLLHHNCNHFSQALCDLLTTSEKLEVPRWCNRIARLGDRVVPKKLATKIQRMCDEEPPKARAPVEKSKINEIPPSVIPRGWYLHPSVAQAPRYMHAAFSGTEEGGDVFGSDRHTTSSISHISTHYSTLFGASNDAPPPPGYTAIEGSRLVVEVVDNFPPNTLPRPPVPLTDEEPHYSDDNEESAFARPRTTRSSVATSPIDFTKGDIGMYAERTVNSGGRGGGSSRGQSPPTCTVFGTSLPKSEPTFSSPGPLRERFPRAETDEFGVPLPLTSVEEVEHSETSSMSVRKKKSRISFLRRGKKSTTQAKKDATDCDATSLSHGSSCGALNEAGGTFFSMGAGHTPLLRANTAGSVTPCNDSIGSLPLEDNAGATTDVFANSGITALPPQEERSLSQSDAPRLPSGSPPPQVLKPSGAVGRSTDSTSTEEGNDDSDNGPISPSPVRRQRSCMPRRTSGAGSVAVSSDYAFHSEERAFAAFSATSTPCRGNSAHAPTVPPTPLHASASKTTVPSAKLETVTKAAGPVNADEPPSPAAASSASSIPAGKKRALPLPIARPLELSGSRSSLPLSGRRPPLLPASSPLSRSLSSAVEVPSPENVGSKASSRSPSPPEGGSGIQRILSSLTDTPLDEKVTPASTPRAKASADDAVVRNKSSIHTSSSSSDVAKTDPLAAAQSGSASRAPQSETDHLTTTDASQRQVGQGQCLPADTSLLTEVVPDVSPREAARQAAGPQRSLEGHPPLPPPPPPPPSAPTTGAFHRDPMSVLMSTASPTSPDEAIPTLGSGSRVLHAWEDDGPAEKPDTVTSDAEKETASDADGAPASVEQE